MRKKFLKTIICLLVAIFVYSSSTTLAAPTIGSISVGAAKFGACTLAGKISPYLSKWIDGGYDRLNKSISKVVAKIPGLSKIPGVGGALGGAIGEDSVPVNDKGLNTTQSRLLAKETNEDVATRCAAMEVLNFMNTSINDLARNSGRNGGASWIRNWRNFQTDSQYRGEGVFRAMLSNTKLCDYFSGDIKGLFGATTPTVAPRNTRTGNLDPYALRANCTMPSGFNLTNYQNDFSGNGGWNSFSRMLDPQNNYYGALFGALDESAKQRSLEESTDLNQVIANRGFTGRSGGNATESCSSRDPNGKCLSYNDIKTPGSVIADSIAASIKTELDVAVSADEISELISTATDVLINRLKDLGNPDEGEYLSYTPPEVSEEAPPGGGGRCAGTSTGPIYEGALDGAIGAVITANPGGIADEFNTANNGFVFLSYLGQELERRGFNATATVLNGHDNPNQGDLMALQRPNEPSWERYDVITDSGAGNAPLRSVVGTDYVGTIPLSCVTGAIERTPVGACLSSNQKTQVTRLVTTADTAINSLAIDDFKAVAIGIFEGREKIDSITKILNDVYVELYDIEKTITDPSKGEIRSFIQTAGNTVVQAQEEFTGMLWSTQSQRVDAERKLTSLKESISPIVNKVNSIQICGTGPSSGTPTGGGEPNPTSEPAF